MASVYKQQLIDWLANLDVKADTVIDIGGSQDPVKGRTKSWDVLHYWIADLPEPHKEKQKPDIEIDLDSELFNYRLSSSLLPANLVFCLEVFDYIRNPSLAFRNLKQLVYVDGYIWVTFPFIYPHHNPLELDGLRYTESSIRYYAEQHNLEIEEIIYRRAESSKLQEYYSEDRFRAAKGYDHSVIGYIVRFKSC